MSSHPSHPNLWYQERAPAFRDGNPIDAKYSYDWDEQA